MKRNIIAKTFTPIYDELEDRLRLAINYEDIGNRVDLMITRSFILNLIPSAEEFISNHYGVVDLQTNTNEPIQNGSTTKTDSTNLELLRADEALLIEVNFSYDPSSQHTTLSLSSTNITAVAKVDALVLQQIFQIMKSAIPYIKWGISHNF
jgi:hypothetical protein